MRLIPAKAGEFRQGQVYVKIADYGRFVAHHLSEKHGDEWRDRFDRKVASETDLLDGWYLLDPSDDPVPVTQESKRDEFWEKCFLAALTGLSSIASNAELSYECLAVWAAKHADACVAERKSSGGVL